MTLESALDPEHLGDSHKESIDPASTDAPVHKRQSGFRRVIGQGKGKAGLTIVVLAVLTARSSNL